MFQKRVETLGSCGSSDRDHDAMYSSDEDDGGIIFTTTETKCERLFEQGLELKLYGDVERALPCFLDCLKGMQHCQYFAKLPQTLHHLGELYNALGDSEKALEFVQAEKLFYEAVVVSSKTDAKESSSRTKRKLFSKRRSTKSNSSGSNPAEYGNLLIKKAVEYEMLARMCAEERNYDLAVDYSGKAAKLRRSVYGDDHPDTITSMETFSLMYAEMGRSEYSAALQQAKTKTSEPTIVSTPLAPECTNTPSECTDGGIMGQETLCSPENPQAFSTRLQEFPLQEECTHTQLTEYKHSSLILSIEGGNDHESTSLLTTGQYKELVQLLQPCTLTEEPSKLTADIHWSGSAPDNAWNNGGERLQVCVVKPELNIEHNRFCPLWVLLLGALLELCLVGYVFYLR